MYAYMFNKCFVAGRALLDAMLFCASLQDMKLVVDKKRGGKKFPRLKDKSGQYRIKACSACYPQKFSKPRVKCAFQRCDLHGCICDAAHGSPITQATRERDAIAMAEIAQGDDAAPQEQDVPLGDALMEEKQGRVTFSSALEWMIIDPMA